MCCSCAPIIFVIIAVAINIAIAGTLRQPPMASVSFAMAAVAREDFWEEVTSEGAREREVRWGLDSAAAAAEEEEEDDDDREGRDEEEMLSSLSRGFTSLSS
jgi:hypothetical protein